MICRIGSEEKGSEWKQALEIPCQLSQDRLVPDTITYGSSISACEKGSVWQRAQQLRQEMADRDLANLIAYNASVSACEKVHGFLSVFVSLHLKPCLFRLLIMISLYTFSS